MTLLIVDDEARIRDLIRKYAAFEGYNVEEASNGMEAIEKCRQKNYDLIIMDVMMPELDGFSACREIRRKSQVPVIMLSARGEEYDRIHGFELGIDDYVVKPFSPRELMMRVSAVLKRTAANAPAASDGEQVTIGDMVVDFAARQVTIKGEKLNLSPKEYDLLFYMVRNRGIALTREKLISDVWGYDFFGDDRTLDTHIKLLRKSLGEYADKITTLRGVGYRFEKDCLFFLPLLGDNEVFRYAQKSERKKASPHSPPSFRLLGGVCRVRPCAPVADADCLAGRLLPLGQDAANHPGRRRGGEQHRQ